MPAPKLSLELLRARGSQLVPKRPGIAPEPLKAEPRSKFTPLTEAELDALIREIPGFDPFAQCEGYEFHCELANRALAFFPEQLCHIEGAMARKPFHLERWQQAA